MGKLAQNSFKIFVSIPQKISFAYKKLYVSIVRGTKLLGIWEQCSLAGREAFGK